MRLAILAISLAALIGLIYLSWQHRFEALSGSCVSNLADLREVRQNAASTGVSWQGSEDQPVLRMQVAAPERNLVHRIGIPDCGAVKFLHLRLRIAGDRLLPGKEIWEDGRLLIEWHRPGGDGPRIEYIGSIRGDGIKEDEFIVSAIKGLAVPVLRLEHMGRSGAFELQKFEVREVRETKWWLYGRWTLAAAWLAWTSALVLTITKISMLRAMGAAAVFVTMGAMAVVPGPWKIQRPFGDAFVIKEVPSFTTTPASPKSTSEGEINSNKAIASPLVISTLAGPEKALGKLPVQGGLLLKAKYLLEPLRPLLHALLIMLPTLAMIWLAGWRPALVLALLLSISIELGQIAFGYGFDRVDIADLFHNSFGIAAAMIVAKVYVLWRTQLPLRYPQKTGV